MNFWEVFDQSVARFDDRTAVEVQRRDALDRWTYGELRGLALSRTAFLAARGIRPGDRAAILADNDAWWCAAYLGILRAGAVVVPLDTNYSAAQVNTIVRDSGARVLFANARVMPIAREALAGLPGVTLVDISEQPAAGTAHVAAHVALASDPAVILYTSGTTADPKGVVLSHANLLAEQKATFEAVYVNEHDSVLGVLPLFHALPQIANLVLPLAVGARIVFLETISSTELLRALAERRITVFVCVPQFFYLIHERMTTDVQQRGVLGRLLFRRLLHASFALRRAGLNPGRLFFGRMHRLLGHDMRLFITGGSKFDPVIGRDFYALGFTILQAYGLTETSGAATITRAGEIYLDTVGRPLPGQEITVREPEEEGLDGEIAIRGPIVMQGYFNRPEATSAVMRDGWFSSGDLGRLDGAGRLTITGRKKEVIVLSSGKNIYPEEIEAQYRQSPYVKEICVAGLTTEGEPNAERLFAVVVPNTDLLREKRIVNAGDMIRFEMEGQSIDLPPHKRVLGYQVWFEPLPRTTTGKIKRHEVERRLRDERRRQTVRAAGPEHVETWADDPHAIAAAGIVRGRARGRPVTPDANLELDLGLDSMERVELVTELEQRFGVRVPTDRALEIFTVGELVEAVRPAPSSVEGPGDGQPAGTPVEESWAVLLRDLPPKDDPALSSLLEHRPLAMALLFIISRALRLLFGPGVSSGQEHLPATGPYIIAPNHQSYLDPFIVCSVLPYRLFHDLFVVGATEYFETPLMRWLARQIKLFPVDADANLVSAMKAGAFGLHHGKILMLFPEGERSIDGTVKRFKKGAPILAQHLGVPIVPVALRGSFEIWPRNRALNWKALRPWSRHQVRVQFGSPIRFEPSSDSGESASRLRDAVQRMWNEI